MNLDGLRTHLLSMKSKDITAEELELAFNRLRLRIDPNSSQTFSLYNPTTQTIERATPLDIVVPGGVPPTEKSEPITLFQVFQRLKERAFRLFNKPL